jgi:hypothetical protein
MGKSNFKYIVSGAYVTKTVNTRFRMVATKASDSSPISWVSAGSVGLSSTVGAVVPVPLVSGTPQSFKIQMIFEACSPTGGVPTIPTVAVCNASDSFWEPVNDLYNRLNTDPAIFTRSSFNNGFYYNRAPSTLNGSATTNEDTSVGIVLSASDADGQALAYTVLSGPAHGSLAGSGASRTYIPALNYNGPDSITFLVNDGFVDSNVSTFSLNVNAVNDPPVATPQSVSLDEDTTLGITLGGTDVEGNALTFNVVTFPLHGSLNTDALPNVVYTPNQNFNGADSFTFRAHDGALFSADATVAIAVNPVNDAPVAFDDPSQSTPEDTALEFDLIATDIDGDTLTYVITDQPDNGTLTTDGSKTVHYVPDLNFNGTDTFTFKAQDAQLLSNEATVTIQVPAVNDAPVASDQDVTTDEDTPATILLQASDVDSDLGLLTYTIIDAPANGQILGDGPVVVYVPDADWHGTDSFTFKVTDDGELDSNIATVTILVNSVNDAPVADDLSVDTAEDNEVAITLTASDVDGDALSYSVVQQPAHGTLSGSAPDLVYTPDENYCGPDLFKFVANDNTTDGNVGTVSINVECVNDAPVAQDQSSATDEDTPLPIALVATDVEGDPLTFSVAGGPTHGTLDLDGASVIYTPFADYNGADEFTFTANDGELDSNIATVSLTVNAVNDNPVAGDDLGQTPQYTPVTIAVLANDSDVDGDTISVTSATPGEKGATVVNPDGTITYTPSPNFKDSDVFHYVIGDGQGGSTTGTVLIEEIKCGEDGLQAVQGGPAGGVVSGTIDRQVEPVVGGVDPDTAANIHAYNCALVVPTENAVDDLID